jgi:hypothetical protein
MLPITGMDMYHRLIKANAWIKDFLPNTILAPGHLPPKKSEMILQKMMELPLRGKLGERFEQWEMKRKIARFTTQEDFGEETIFNADVCQGNFDHHRRWTEKELGRRIDVLNVDPLAVEEESRFMDI